MSKPIESLTGLKTDDGWVIDELVHKQAYQTGGHFSVGYLVHREDDKKRVGFLKALDFSKARESADEIRVLEDMTRTYNFERDVLALCRGANLDRVVVAISDGAITVPDAPLGRVFYLIFELADGDVRQHAVLRNSVDFLWSLRALQHVATGLSQLHGQGVFHQDLKPSNVLTFSEGQTAKLADLGRAHCATIASPHEMLALAGQPFYAAPEFLYSFYMPEQVRCRAASELYMFGSMIFFFFTGSMLTPSVVAQLRPEHRPQSLAADNQGWQGSYDDVLPYLRSGYADVLAQLRESLDRSVGQQFPELADEIFQFAGYLSEPDPRLRGHPSDKRMRHGNQYSLTRFVSGFDRFVKKASIRMRQNAKAA